MKLSVYLLVLNAIGAYAATFQDQLAKLEAIREPSVDLLNQYGALIKEYPSEPLLYKAYEKLGFTQLLLNKETQTIESFEKSLALNKGNVSLRKNLFDLYFKFGYKEKFNKIIKKYDIKKDDSLVKLYESKFNEIEELIKKNEFDAAVNISPHDPNLRSARIVHTIHTMPKDDYTKQQEHFDNLIDDYLNLIKASTPVASLTNNLFSLAQIYSFNNLELKNSNTLLKKALQYDMEDKLYIRLSKFLNKYSDILEIVAKYKKIFQAWDDKGEESELSEVDEKEVKEFFNTLIDPSKMVKIRKYNEDYVNNLDFMSQLSGDFNRYFNVSKNTFDLTLSKLQALNAFFSKNWKVFLKEHQNVVKIDKTQENSLLMIAYKVDEALKKSDYNKVKELLNLATKNMKKSSILKPMLDQYNKHAQEEQRQRQQQQYQQQQQQQERFRQQQVKAQGPPKNDYYKILGISKSSTQQEIKKAYREMTKQYHPDKYKGDLSKEDIEHKMTQINHAYEVLSDEKTRKDYDQYGDDPNDAERQNNGGGAPRGGFNFNSQGGQFGGGSFGGFSFGGSGFKFSSSRSKKH